MLLLVTKSSVEYDLLPELRCSSVPVPWIKYTNVVQMRLTSI
jgi:hypothetical protein